MSVLGVQRPTIAERLRSVIEEGLSERYISQSCFEGIQTGNHYQSVTLGHERTHGFRHGRDEVFDAIAFHGKSVLDLGSNLGELSRAARERGADLVDGFEYDPFFVELACAVNALNRTTRVSFFERDITQPAAYERQYDIVLAFSVCHYVLPRLAELARVTKELLVVETHRLEDNLESHYIDPCRAYFPYYEILGSSDWSIHGGDSDRRAVIAFARSAAALESGLARREVQGL